jgi:exodeoxyribonuclease VII small subunit
MTAKKQTAAAGEQTFEEAIRRLEQIVERLEKGEVPLDQAMQLYEEGLSVSRQCAEKLKKAEVVLKRLTKDAEGNFALTDEEE